MKESYLKGNNRHTNNKAISLVPIVAYSSVCKLLGFCDQNDVKKEIPAGLRRHTRVEY
jgi:hypothetical protein